MENKLSEKIGIDAIRLQMMQTIIELNNIEASKKKPEALEFEIERSKALNSLYSTYAHFAIAEVKHNDLLLKRDILASRGEFTDQIANKKIHSNFFNVLE